MGKKKNIKKIPNNNSPKRYVTEGVTLECVFGSKTVQLQTPGRKTACIDNKHQANIMDFKSMVNIPSFGQCKCRGNPTVAAATAANKGKLTPMPCVPNTTMPWINGKADVKLEGAPALLNTSTNMCLWGGALSIAITDNVSSKSREKIESGITKIANGGLMGWIGWGVVDVAAAALVVATAPAVLLVGAVVLAAGVAAMTMGVADVIEGAQDVHSGVTGSTWQSFNGVRDVVFNGNDDAYNLAEMVTVTVGSCGASGLLPFAATGKMVVTSAQKLQGENKNAVASTKRAANRTIRLKNSKIRNQAGRTYKCRLRDPVDAITGEVVLDRQDFALPGRIPMQWTRHYGSQNNYRGLCGRGWETPGDIRLEFPADGTVLFHDGSDSPSCFDYIPTTTPVVEPIDGRLLCRQDSYYTVQFKEGLTFYFPVFEDQVELILVEQISDRFGNTVQYLRDANGLREIRESNGRKIEVVSQQGRIESMHLCHPGQTPHLLVRYSYDDHGNLAAAYDALDVPYRFEYRDNLLIKHTNRNGLSFHYEYDRYTPEGRCTHTWGDGGLYEGRFVFHDDQKTVEAIGVLGTIAFLYDDCYRILQETNPLGGVTKYEYDGYGRIAVLIDPDGHRTEYVYDRSGNLLKLTRPDGQAITTEYDAMGKPLRITDPNGALWKEEWNAKDQLSKQISPLGAVSQYQYDESGQLTDYIDPLGNNTKLAFDNYGNLINLTDAQGQITEFTYDSFGRINTRLDPARQRTSYQYDSKGRLIRAILPSDNTITCDYDAEDNLIAYKDENGAVTRLEYCGVNELKRRIQPDGQTVEYEYNAEEQLIAVINQRGERYELKRDAEGRIVEEVDYWGQSRKYSYGAAGYLQESIDPLGRCISYQTDPLGRIVAKVLPDPEGMTTGQSETFKYDANGNLIACANREIEIKRCFDLEGKLVKEEQGAESSHAYTYDLNGNRVSRTTTICNGATTRTKTFNYTYDNLGLATNIEIDGHQSINFFRNRLGRIIHENLGKSLKRWFEYNDAGYLIGQGVTSGVGPLFKQEYAYDRVGNLVSKSDSVFGKDKFFYDPMGRITRQIDPVGQVQQYLYDQAGDRLTTAINAEKPDDPEPQRDRTGVFEGQTYHFDCAGNLIKRTGQQETTKFNWDANGRLIKSITGGQTTIYTYDPLGRRIAKQSGDTTLRFVWDGDALLGELRFVTQPAQERGGGKTGADVDAEPVCTRLREWVYYPGSFEPLAMVQAEGLAGEADANGVSGTSERIYFYSNDPNGCPNRLLDEYGKVVWAARYDAFGKVKKLPVAEVEQPLRLQGQYFDGETGLCYNRWRYYEPEIGAFVSQDPLGLIPGENTYQYASNVQTWVDPLGLTCEKPNKYVRKNLPELTGTTKEAFTDGNYKLRTFKAGERVHRSPWVPDELPENPGSWLSTRKTVTKIGTESSSNIAKWGNPIEKLRTYEFTQDTTVYYGKVAGGTGYQALIPADVKPGNVLKFVREVNLK